MTFRILHDLNFSLVQLKCAVVDGWQLYTPENVDSSFSFNSRGIYSIKITIAKTDFLFCCAKCNSRDARICFFISRFSEDNKNSLQNCSGDENFEIRHTAKFRLPVSMVNSDIFGQRCPLICNNN